MRSVDVLLEMSVQSPSGSSGLWALQCHRSLIADACWFRGIARRTYGPLRLPRPEVTRSPDASKYHDNVSGRGGRKDAWSRVTRPQCFKAWIHFLSLPLQAKLGNS